MAAITALKKTIVDDTPSRVAHEVRKEWNALVDRIAALDSGTATVANLITEMQKAKKIVTSRELPAPPASATP
jgi:hypothetical protein